MNKYLLLAVLVCAASVGTFAQVNSRSKNKSVSKNQTHYRLKMAYFRGQQEDLPSIRVVDFSDGAVFVVYYDDVSKRVAEESIPMLADFYKQIADITAVDAGKINWFSVVFTTAAKYVPPRRGSEVRWKVLVDETGKLGIQALRIYTELFRTNKRTRSNLHFFQTAHAGFQKVWRLGLV